MGAAGRGGASLLPAGRTAAAHSREQEPINSRVFSGKYKGLYVNNRIAVNNRDPN
jgi:hypothetical protein